MSQQKNTNDLLNMDETISNSEEFLIKNKNLLLGAVIALVVIVGGYMAYKNFVSEPKELKASEAIFKGEQYFGADNYEAALNGDSLGFAGFVKLADEFSGTKAGNLANAYAGICYAQLGKYEDAEKYIDIDYRRGRSNGCMGCPHAYYIDHKGDNIGYGHSVSRKFRDRYAGNAGKLVHTQLYGT